MAAVLVVVVVALAAIGLIYTQPFSRIRLHVANGEYAHVEVKVYIDGNLKCETTVSSGDYQIVGAWSVSEGNHTVAIDRGGWIYVDEPFIRDWFYVLPDGVFDIVYGVDVGPLSTKNVWMSFGWR